MYYLLYYAVFCMLTHTLDINQIVGSNTLNLVYGLRMLATYLRGRRTGLQLKGTRLLKRLLLLDETKRKLYLLILLNHNRSNNISSPDVLIIPHSSICLLLLQLSFVHRFPVWWRSAKCGEQFEVVIFCRSISFCKSVLYYGTA